METNEENKEESFYLDGIEHTTVEKMFEDFEKADAEWKKMHPLRGHIRDWLDNRFPNGIAEYRAYYVLQTPWKILRYWKNQVKFAWQRVFRGWDDSAVWSMNYYLADLIPQLIKSLRENKQGVPMFALEGLEADENYNYSEEQLKIAEDRWNKILDEIIEGFESWKKFDEKSLFPQEYESDEDYQKFMKAFALLKEHWGSLWD